MSSNAQFVLWIKKAVDFILYSNLWIAVSATAMTAQTSLLLQQQYPSVALLGFIFCATLFVYSLHQLISQRKAKSYTTPRLQRLRAFRGTLVFTTLLGCLFCINFYTQLQLSIQVVTIGLALLSLAYILPILPKKKRFRDLHFLKLFLVGWVWTFVTVLLPFLESDLAFNTSTFYLMLERMLFIFAIAIPFDIRDGQADQRIGVKTLPNTLGVKESKLFAFVSLALASFIILLNMNYLYNFPHVGRFAISFLITSILIHFTNPNKPDQYFIGLVDGMMILQFLLLQ